MTNFIDTVVAVARKLAVLRTGTATSGSATTLADTVHRTEVDEHFIDGTIFITGTTDDLAPLNEWGIVSAFVNATGLATFTELTAVIGAGDTYGIISSRFPLDIIKTAINDEIIKYKAPRFDRTSLDVVIGQSEYTLPAGINRYNLINVYEETNDDADDPRWVAVDFEVQAATAGSQHTLTVKGQRLGSGNDFMLEYSSWCAPLLNPTDILDESIPLPRLVVHAAAQAVLIVMSTHNSAGELDKELWKFLRDQADEADKRYPVRPIQRKARVQTVGGSYQRSESVIKPPPQP